MTTSHCLSCCIDPILPSLQSEVYIGPLSIERFRPIEDIKGLREKKSIDLKQSRQ